MGSIGLPEMIFIFVLALLIFGPKKLPELGRSLGKGLFEFRRASSELRSSLEREMQHIEQETKVEDVSAAPSTPSTPSSETTETTPSATESNPSDPSEYGSYEYEGYRGERKN
ncbi:MAG: TatA/E family twin arginine-targeting protein translocase [Gammaproteobacteria bacterium]